jgi:hypothetical protein
MTCVGEASWDGLLFASTVSKSRRLICTFHNEVLFNASKRPLRYAELSQIPTPDSLRACRCMDEWNAGGYCKTPWLSSNIQHAGTKALPAPTIARIWHITQRPRDK